MTNPKDPWGQRPGDAPTEHLGPPGAFGHGEYPPTEQYDPWSTPPSAGTTREIPPLDSQWGAYEPGGRWQGDQQWAGGTWAGAPGQQPGMPGPPPGANPPPDQYVPPGQGPHKRNTGLWIALGLGVIALVGVVGVAAGLLLGGGEETDTTAAGSTGTTHTLPFQAAPSTTGQLPGLSGLPGLPELGLEELGATVGTITANDGGTLTIATMTGGDVTVRTDAATQVISLSVLHAADLPVGEMVVVQGEKGSDGTIQARIIVSTALPGGGR
ncbi:DUF5666 domain-containing protein [Nocardia higoensis]|uniref:DUF5666 domain-containing protein n=1 Tax=Nocardia higoensis TaxID=228599 RepID=UPI000593F785|nr:DUF5666 domain-containing protein [Nocardia higoensis]